ncbi:MAG: ammonium transporter [Nitrososphaerota archaeon]|nr:ammonium transporter [Candidatus Calditenuaceae archaeon]MDW8073324.1 ammonium transporter [Nitrososphaerota archaeon]
MVDAGDTAWVLVSAALVMLMTPGLGFFYAGLSRRKNVVAVLMQCFTAVAVITVIWALWGYSLAFGPSLSGFIGGLEWLGLGGVGSEPNPDYAPTIPHSAFMLFQAMFAIITPALIVGAFAERVRFGPFLLFLVLWSTLVYAPIAHWVWGVGGWLRGLGALDFAGGTVVHISSGVSALVAAIVIGRRLGYGSYAMEPSNPTLVILGAALLWFGWFGFNAGSALGSGGLASSAFMVTHLSASAAALTWTVAGWIHKGKPSSIGAASGAVAGLVAITPASGFVGPLSAIVIGAVAGILCYIGVNVRAKFGVDDSLDVWGVHGVGGTWGAIATGIFADASINPAGANGLLLGNPALLGAQLIGVAATWAYAGLMTFIIVKVVDSLLGLRVKPMEEMIGLDITQHGEYIVQ